MCYLQTTAKEHVSSGKNLENKSSVRHLQEVPSLEKVAANHTANPRHVMQVHLECCFCCFAAVSFRLSPHINMETNQSPLLHCRQSNQSLFSDPHGGLIDARSPVCRETSRFQNPPAILQGAVWTLWKGKVIRLRLAQLSKRFACTWCWCFPPHLGMDDCWKPASWAGRVISYHLQNWPEATIFIASISTS